ncbi:MAG: CBU_0592 family membrane protein [Rickettsiales bacterium]
MASLITLIGLLGVAINLVAYGMLSAGRIKATQTRYQVMNIAGTTGILLSLLVQWNLASFVMNLAWLLISIVGLIRIARIGRIA